MMAWAAGLLGKVGSTPLLIASCLALCVSLYQQYGNRQDAKVERIEAKAEMVCNQTWELAISKRKESDARIEAQEVREQIEIERGINTGLANELSKISTEHEDLRRQLAAAPAIDPSRCLSDSVLTRLRGAGGHGDVDGAGQAQGGKGGSGRR